MTAGLVKILVIYGGLALLFGGAFVALGMRMPAKQSDEADD